MGYPTATPQPGIATSTRQWSVTGRRFNTSTNLGKIMVVRGVTATQTSSETGIHPRTLTEYLAGRKKPTARHLMELAAYLRVKPSRLIDDPSHPSTPILDPHGDHDGDNDD